MAHDQTLPGGSGAARPGNPFLDDVCVGAAAGRPLATVGAINAEAVGRILDGLPEPEAAGAGRVALVLAPRAGFGKTHLIERLAGQVEAQVVRVRFDRETDLTWTGVFDSALDVFQRPAAGGEKDPELRGLTALDVSARYLFALLNRRLIAAGEVPCANRAEAEAALERDFLKLFDFADESQAVARWFAAHFEKLLPMTAAHLAELADIPRPRAEDWLRALCGYAQSSADPASERRDGLRWLIDQGVEENAAGAGPFAAAAANPDARGGERKAKSRLREFARIATLQRPIVFVFDHLDVFFRDGEAGQRVAYFVAQLQEMVPRELTILSLNEDLWETAFFGCLPSALEDRLTGNVVNLRGLDRDAAEALVRRRLERTDLTEDDRNGFVRFLRLREYFSSENGKLVSPRAALRYAAIHWDVFAREDESGRRALAAAEDPPPPTTDTATESLGLSGGLAEFPPSPSDAPPSAGEHKEQDAGDASPEPAEPADDEDDFYDGSAPGDPGAIRAAVEDSEETDESAELTPLATGGGGFLQGETDEPEPERRVLGGEVRDAIAAAVGGLAPEGAESDEDGESENRHQAGAAGLEAEDEDENPFARLKKMLHRLRRERGEPVPDDDDDEIAPGDEGIEPAPINRAASSASAVPPSARTDSISAPPPPEDAEDGSVLAQFRAAREKWEREADESSLDREKIRRLIRISGKRFPVVKFDEFPLPGSDTADVARWSFKDNEICFGFAPAADARYWNELTDFIESRASLHDRDSGPALHLKLVGFGSSHDPAFPPAAESGSGNGHAEETSRERWDPLTLDRSALAALYAADELIRSAEAGDVDADPGQILGILARQLDFFWKRITRPIAKHHAAPRWQVA